ncbi:MAG: terminase large subunit [Candidatus Omnitrophota bacterium]
MPNAKPIFTQEVVGDPKDNPFDPCYKHDIVNYLSDHFYVVETKAPIVLEPWQKDQILTPLFAIDPTTGLRKHTLAILGMPKKNGKSSLSAAILNYFLFQGEDYGELILAANSKEQSSWIIFDKLKKSLQMNRHQFQHVRINDDYIENTRTGTVARVIAQNYKTAAGCNPSLVVFDELWSFEDTESDNARKFYEELTTVPTRKEPMTVITSYAGYAEDTILFELYKRGLAGKDPKMFFFWTHENLASWITSEYLATQKERLRPNTYLRLHENRWTSGEDQFIDIADWDKCVDVDHRPLIEDKARELRVVAAVDIGTKSDTSAIVAVAKKDNRIMLVAHRKWAPTEENPIDIEETVEKYLLELKDRFNIIEARYDPYQFHRSGMSLVKEGLNMVEFPQTVANLTEMGQNLFDLIKGKNLLLYEDADMRAHAQNARAQETPRGFRIVKGKSTKKIDLMIALAMAALGAIKDDVHEGAFFVIEHNVWPD